MTSNAAMRERLAARYTPRNTLVLRRRLLPVLIAGCFASGFVAPGAVANPMGAQVVNGQATFSNQGNVLSVTNTPGAIINWQSFSINAGEVTRFIQQSADSAVLNRIVGQDPSQILGALQSNGRVFLINPNGILFGQGAQVDVNGLVASTLNISNEDFLNGRMNFAAGDKAGNLQNQGVITTPTGGRVYLIAPNVENSGIITSPKGEVLLAAGHTVQLVDSANPDLHVVISAPESQAVNLGQIVAQGGKAGVYGALIHQRGLVSADSAVVGENGKIVFKASKDTILDAGSRTSATGAGTGGEIQLLGERVGLVGDAKVDASGQQGGGTVLVGGDFQGKNTDIQNAQYAYVGKDTEIKADAIESGDGGKVIVWSDNTTRAFGKISARGGAQSGNGGFVEVSGKQDLEYRALADLTAANGKTGTLLLDPASLTIVGGTGDGDGYMGSTGFNGIGGTTSALGKIFYDNTAPSVVYQSEIEAQSSTAHIVLEATNNISVSGTFANGAVRLANGANLTMRTRNGPGDSSTGGGIDLTGSTHGANLAFETYNGGSIWIEAGADPTPWFATLNLGRLNAGNGAVTLRSSGTIGINNTVSAGNANVNVTAGGNITFTAAGRLYGGAVNVLTKGLEASISMPVGSEINSWGSPVSLTADNMSLLGTINAGTNTVTLAPFTASPSIVLGSNDDAFTNMLALSTADLNSIRAGVLRIGNTANSGGINIAAPLLSGPGGALEHVFSGLSMTTSGAITQQTGAIIAGASAVQATGSSVNLSEANSTGVVAGTATTGGFWYRSSNLLTPSTVDGVSGISLSGSPDATRRIRLYSDSTYGINQNSPINTNGGELVLRTPGAVNLLHSGNAISKVGADLSLGALGSGYFELYSATNLEVGVAATGFSGITTNSQGIDLAVAGGRTLTINQALNAGTAEVAMEADSLVLNSTVTGALVDIAPVTAGRAITVGSTTCAVSPCLNVVNLHRVAAHTIGIGREDAFTAGPIHVAGITNTGTAALTDRNSATMRIGLLSASSISQSGAINVPELGAVGHGTVNLSHSGNSVNSLAGESWGGAFAFTNSKPLVVGDIVGTELDGGDYGLYGIWSNGGNISLTTASGDIVLKSGVDAGAGSVTLRSAGAILGATPEMSGYGYVSANSLNAEAVSGISLSTEVASLRAINTGSGDIAIENYVPLALQDVRQNALMGNIFVNNYGEMKTTAGMQVVSVGGNIELTAHSPLTIDGAVSSTSGNIMLEAGASGSASDNLTINAPVSTSGSVLLKAGTSIFMNAAVTGSPVTLQPNGNSTYWPSVEECVADPTLAGCATLPPAEVAAVDQSLAIIATAANAVTTTTQSVTSLLPTSASASTTGTTGTASTASTTTTNDSSQNGESTNEEQQTATATQDNGANTNEAAKKMYCN
ncbi:MAG TPA: filamentous hemagglutinin N-terminal domain-containing protein [Noviherbaspirillum sp.]|nr:filamentous hemagglutinin N-terminal domain-containing protein [Noviherbaspirillum sp.]